MLETMQAKGVICETASDGVTADQVASIVARACPASCYANQRVLLIVPDGTRTAPVGMIFQALHRQIGSLAAAFDVLIALGTHQPMSDAAICERLGITEAGHRERYREVHFFNHHWDDPASLQNIGTIPAAEISALTNGLFAMDVPVEINKM